MFEEMKRQGYLQVDETPVKVLDPEVKGKGARGYLWFFALRGYLADGRFEIDNNLVENPIRGPAVGRRRWLFIGHPDAGWRSAVIHSMIISCRRRGLNAQEYLTDVLRRLPSMNITQIGELLPGRWKPSPPSPPPASG